ncbi:MAG: hypothetical protein ACLFO2_02875 [Candidatus Woesearchaeota archaeon]
MLVAAYGLILLSQITTLFGLHRLVAWAQKHYGRRDAYLPLWGLLALLKGFLVATALFPKDVAVPALAVLVYGDAFATLVGRDLSSAKLPWHRKKTWAGLLGGTAASFLVLTLLLTPLSAFLASLAGMLVESFPRPQPLLDDNLAIPLAAGLVLLAL